MAEEEDEPRRGRRGLMIVAALVGAIGLGGGMAYAYKTFFPSRTGPVAVIKDTQGPTKSKPEFADGKGFAAHRQEAPEPAWRRRLLRQRPATRQRRRTNASSTIPTRRAR